MGKLRDRIHRNVVVQYGAVNLWGAAEAFK